MSTNYHTPYVDGTTKFRPTHMNAPLAELDTQITANAADIATLQAQVAQLLENVFAASPSESPSVSPSESPSISASPSPS